MCFTSHVSEPLLKEIASRKHLVKRVLSFNEINLDFFLFNDNVFHLSRKNILPVFKLVESKQGVDSPHVQLMLNELCHRLFTVCSVFMEFPWVQYQGNSPLAKALAVKLNEYLTRFYTTQAKEKIRIREPRGTMIICDRSFDLLSPVLHDFYYQQLVYEFKEVGEDGEVMLNEGKQKMAFLND